MLKSSNAVASGYCAAETYQSLLALLITACGVVKAICL